MKIRAKALHSSRYLGTKKGKYYILDIEDSPWKSSYTGMTYGTHRSIAILGRERVIHTMAAENSSLGYSRYFAATDSILNPNTKIL